MRKLLNTGVAMLTALALGLAGCQVDDIEAAEANKINTDGIFADYSTKN